MGFPHKFSISAQKVTHKGLVDAPDPQEAESGRERQRLVRFSNFWSQMIAFGYVPLLDYAGLKNLYVWSLRTPLLFGMGAIRAPRINSNPLYQPHSWLFELTRRHS